MPESYAEKLEAVLENTILPDWKVLVASYFETENDNRESVLDVLYSDLDRIKCVQGRPLLPGIIQDLSVIGWDKDMGATLPFTDPNAEWTNEEMIKYSWLKGDQTGYWKDRRVCDIGCGSGTSTIITHRLGSINSVYEPLKESCTIACCNFILFNYDVLFFQEIASIENIDMSYDTYIMSRIFYEDFADENVELAKFLRDAGKEIIIASKSLIEGTNPHATLNPSEYEMLLDIPIQSDPEGYGNRYVVKLV
tara:strand:+ start:13 stop:765 length:753 start_codon:yes stop_codon:yes gene_type:complete